MAGSEVRWMEGCWKAEIESGFGGDLSWLCCRGRGSFLGSVINSLARV